MTSSDEEAVYHDAISTDAGQLENIESSAQASVALSAQNPGVKLNKPDCNVAKQQEEILCADKSDNDKKSSVLSLIRKAEAHTNDSVTDFKDAKVGKLKQGIGKRSEKNIERSSPTFGEVNQRDFVVVDKTKIKIKQKTDTKEKVNVSNQEASVATEAIVDEIVPAIEEQSWITDSKGYSHVVNHEGGQSETSQTKQSLKRSEDTGYIEENIYDAVNTDYKDEVAAGFQVVDKNRVGKGSVSKGNTTGATRQGPVKVFSDDVNYEWKRREAKKKSKALKRGLSTSSGKSHTSNPLTQHGQFDDPNKGACPDATEEKIGHVNPFSVHENSDSDDSNISCFTDSTFSSDCSDDNINNDPEAIEDFDPNKPLPPKPPKTPHQIHVRDIANVLLLKPKLVGVKGLKEEPATVLHRVDSKRQRPQPSLPDTPDNIVMSQTQIKLRGVLLSLIDSERNYVNSLERLSNDYKEEILVHVKRSDVKVTFDKVEDIYILHKMFQIELGAKLENWNQKEEIGSIFTMFSSPMTRSIYSEYVNNYEAASEIIRDVENTKPAFRDFLKRMQMSSADRLSLSGLMLKPVQRFPQFIMIIKDLLKYTPRDHHDREQLQEAVTCIENVTHELNESKRQSEQLYHGQQILGKLAAKIPHEKNVFLVRQDDMEQLSQKTDGAQVVKHRRLFLLKDRLISVQVFNREQDGYNVERFVYKWHQKLENLELTTSAITPNMYTKVDMKTSGTTISSPKTEFSEDDPYSVASELTDMMHDITVLAKVHQLVASLRLSYPGLTEDNVNVLLTKLQQQIQGKDYQLQMLNSSAIIIFDSQRRKKYVFSAANANMKQEWCIDFLMAKYSLEVVNIPSWHKQDKDNLELCQPALMMKHISIDMQRTFTKMKCAVRVYFPTRNEGSVEHLWIWSSSEGQGQVSVVSLHTAKPALIESFQGAKSEVITAESVPGFATEGWSEAGAVFAEDTVWTSTMDEEILVYSLSEDNNSHRHPVHTFKIGCVVISMKCIDDSVFCGNRSGVIIVFHRNDDGVWSEVKKMMLGLEPVNSMICVSENLWATCGNQIFSIDADYYEIKERVDHQLAIDDGHPIHFNLLVKAGVGVWASLTQRPNISLYHSESRKLLQEVNICKAINEFISVYSFTRQDRRDYEVTSLMASLGRLWVGTNVGLILAYPLPRLRDGIPRIQERPQVALHGHSGPVRFLIPVQYGPITGSPIRRRPESVLKKYKVEETVIKHLPKVSTDDKQRNTLYKRQSADIAEEELEEENIYEEVGPKTSPRMNSETSPREEVQMRNKQKSRSSISNRESVLPRNRESVVSNVENYYDPIKSVVETDVQDKPVIKYEPLTGQRETELSGSGEHTYFVLEPHAKEQGLGQSDSHVANVNNIDAALNGQKGSPSIEIASKSQDSKCEQFLDDDSEKVTRRLLSSSEGSSQQTNFLSELQKKVKQRNSLEDLIDRDANQDNVALLYPTLARPKTLNFRLGAGGDMLSPSYDDPSEFIRPGMNTAILSRRPDYSSLRVEQRSNSKTKNSKIGKSEKPDKGAKGKKSAVSFNEELTPKVARKSSVGSSFVAGSTVDTLRKQDSNTILVLSGGDGYKDWKKRQSLPNYRPEEPCMVFWMYKF